LKTRTARIAGSLVALSLLAAACGDDDDDNAATDTEATSAPAATAGSAESAAPTTGGTETTPSAGTETTASEGTETTPTAGTETTPSAGTEAGGTGQPATGEPIKVMVLSQLDAPDFAFPEIEHMVSALASSVNEDGGINGQPIEIVACNEKRDQNAAAACARDAVSDDVVAVLGIFTLFGDSILPVLEPAGIPYVGNSILSASDSSSPVAFPLDGGVVGNGAAIGSELAKSGCTAVGAIGYDNAASTLYMSWVQKGVESAGATWAGDTRVPEGNPDYGPAVASILGDGADCTFLSLPPAEAAKAAGAIGQAGQPLKIGTGITTLPQTVISSVPAAATEGAVLTSANPSWSDTDFPGVQDAIDTALANGASQDDVEGSYGLTSWARAEVLFNAMKTIDGDVTKDSVMEAMSNITDPGTQLLGTFSTTEEFPVQGFNRLFNFTYLTYNVSDQQATLTSNEFADASDIVRGG
jgi:ABC-type branched-subunit amino acid transport system substrate-binding protein